MAARPYRPSGSSDSGAVPLLFAAALVAGVAAGLLLGLVSHALISLLVVFPLLVGFAAGGVATWRIGAGRVRAPLVAAVAGLLGGLAGQATTHVVDYQFFRRDAVAAVRADGATGDLDAQLDDYLQQQTGSAGFAGYLRFQAQQGVTLKRGSEKGIELTGIGAWILWILELLLAAGTGAAMAWSRAKEPFCEHCRRWYDQKEVLAEGDAGRWGEVVAAVERGDAAGGIAALGERTPKTRALLRLASCSRCQAHEPVLQVVVGSRLDTRKPREKQVYESLVRHDLARALREAAATPASAPVTSSAADRW